MGSEMCIRDREVMVEQKFNIVIIDYDMETIKDMTDLVYKIITEGYGK